MCRVFGSFLFLIMIVWADPALIVSGQTNIQIDGVYQLVSESTDYTKPKNMRVDRKPTDWSGMYFFMNGYFSVSIMDQTRNTDWFSKFPQNTDEIGYQSFAGRYEFSGTTLTLTPELKLHPFYDRLIKRYEVKVEGNTLMLTETIRPYTEDRREGKRVIILSKVDPK